MPEARNNTKTGTNTVITCRGELPSGWVWHADDRALVLEFEDGVEEQAARLTVTTDATASQAAGRPRQWRRVTSSEPWPHRTWSHGQLEQAVYLDGDVAMAHDVFSFRTATSAVRVDLDCGLTELLALEDDVATIVAQLVEEVAA